MNGRFRYNAPMATDRKTPVFLRPLEAAYPGLVETIRSRIVSDEAAFDGRARSAGRAGAGDSFLWEHTLLVAGLADRIAREGGLDPRPAVLTALLHDTGKFGGGRYHEDGRPEEAGAARFAGAAMTSARVPAAASRRVVTALGALHAADTRPNVLAGIVHDADFLAKAGALGAAGFFIKSTLRGRTLLGALMTSLSKELTTAANLPGEMRTRAGRRLAERKSRESLRFYRVLLSELRESRGADLRVEAIRVRRAGGRGRGASTGVLLVLARACDACGGKWRKSFATERGLKCETLEARIACARCGNDYRVSFCLPANRGRRG
jgi:HD superfamily phosphodiesterase